jgi:hypothetical protein
MIDMQFYSVISVWYSGEMPLHTYGITDLTLMVTKCQFKNSYSPKLPLSFSKYFILVHFIYILFYVISFLIKTQWFSFTFYRSILQFNNIYS